MAHASAPQALLGLARSFRRLNVSDPLTQCLAPRLTRTFASQTDLPIAEFTADVTSNPPPSPPPSSASAFKAPSPHISTDVPPGHPLRKYTTPHPITLHSFPSLEPTRQLFLHPSYLPPLRRDILHRAVIYEGDATRLGTASTKHRTQVHGSGRKIQRQKGTGRARVGDKKSPIRRGGGVVFGPHPRDFSTGLPQKIYDQAWRMALGYRLSRGELIVVDGPFALPEFSVGAGGADGPGSSIVRAGTGLLNEFFLQNNFGHAGGRSLLVTAQLPLKESNEVRRMQELAARVERLEGRTPSVMELQGLLQRDEDARQALIDAMEPLGREGELKDIEDVDVKDLLEKGRIIIEQSALLRLFERHRSDLRSLDGLPSVLSEQL